MLATYGMRPPREMYPAFLEAHHEAVARGGLTPELRCNRAHGLHMFEGRLDEAESELREVIRERPTFASGYVRAAMVHVTQGRLDDALEMIARGQQADPLLPTVPMVEILIRISRREWAAAMTVGAKTVELHPYLQRVRSLYAQALEFAGRLEEALTQYQIGSAMSPDLPWLRALEGSCLAKLGRRREARSILKQLQTLRESTYIDAYFMAPFLETLGRRKEALAELGRAFEENSAWWYSFEFDPKMLPFKGDPRFERLRDARVTMLRKVKAAGRQDSKAR
jgi:tetratricopeptide (TPR) repeat protein